MLAAKTLLVSPPFTQLSTPYPATCYLKGFLDSKGVDCEQRDLSIDTFRAIFCSEGLRTVFESIHKGDLAAYHEVYKNQATYIDLVDKVIAFLSSSSNSSDELINELSKLAGHRLKQFDAKQQGINIDDCAKHMATLFIEEIGDFIKSNIDELFEFTRYAESLARSASSFDEIDEFLQYEPTVIEEIMLEQLDAYLESENYQLICFTIPFPGNLFSALRCAQHIKFNYPDAHIAFGGGYCNTEIRDLEDPRIFEYIDFITLDDGEGPLFNIHKFLTGELDLEGLERTFIKDNGRVRYVNATPNTLYHHSTLPCPTYKGLDLKQYTSFLDLVNPMHRMWSDGLWLKLTISHGCYWKQCSFCDVSLDYIGNYQNSSAKALVDKMESLMQETGLNGFHFVDEAAPPKMMRAMAEEILRRNLKVRWWTNIRFEKTFTPELCELLAKSGLIAVTGGLEVASDRLLELMKKGVTVEQVARVSKGFEQNGVLVHAYLMYGFPTQTAQETIDALEVVRQLFENSCIHSAFWHLFTATAHSPIGQSPEDYSIEITGPQFQGFANNDLFHIDSTGTNHEAFTTGLNTSLKHYMTRAGYNKDLSDWFDFEVPNTTVSPELIRSAISQLDSR